MNVIYSGHISGSFSGFNQGNIFKLDNGTYWIQSEYEYDYMNEYDPDAVVLESCGKYYLLVCDKKVEVEQLYNVIESRIDGDFEGWDEDKAYKLENGDVWQQSTYHYEYKYAYNPEALIYSHNGTTYMLVDGATAEVQRISSIGSDYKPENYGGTSSLSSLSLREQAELLAMASQMMENRTGTRRIENSFDESNYPVGTVSVNESTNGTSSSPKKTSWISWFVGVFCLLLLGSMLRSCIFGGSSSSIQTVNEEIVATTTARTFYVTLNVECEENLMFSKYDVVVLIDDKEAGIIDHGTTKSFTGNMYEGKHTIKFHESGYENVDGSCEIDVTEPVTINCKIHCTGSQVEIIEVEMSATEIDPLSGVPVSNRLQRNGFDSSTNKKLELGDFDCEIPDYWNIDKTNISEEGLNQSYVAKADNDFASLLCFVLDDPNNATIKDAISNKKDFAETFAGLFGASRFTVLKQEVANFADVSGLLTVMDIIIEDNNVDTEARVYLFSFASTEKQKFIIIGFVESDTTKYEYTSDFIKTLKSIKKKDEL